MGGLLSLGQSQDYDRKRRIARSVRCTDNPYDGTFDFFRGIGLTDDLGVIRDVITKHFAR